MVRRCITYCAVDAHIGLNREAKREQSPIYVGPSNTPGWVDGMY